MKLKMSGSYIQDAGIEGSSGTCKVEWSGKIVDAGLLQEQVIFWLTVYARSSFYSGLLFIGLI